MAIARAFFLQPKSEQVQVKACMPVSTQKTGTPTLGRLKDTGSLLSLPSEEAECSAESKQRLSRSLLSALPAHQTGLTI